MKFTIVPKLLLLLSVAYAAGAADDAKSDWPTGRGPNQDGKSPLTGLRKDWTGGLRLVWEAKDLCSGDLKNNSAISTPVVVHGILVALGRGDEEDLVSAYDAEKGTPLWKQKYAAKAEKPWADLGNGPRTAPVISGDCVYTLGAYGHLACWDLKSGAQKWLIQTRADSKTNVPYWGVCGAPVVFGAYVLVKVGGYDQGPNAPLVMAYDKVSGKLAWKSADCPGSWAPLAIFTLDGKDQLLAWHNHGLKGLDPATGKEFWNIPWSTPYDCHATIPAVSGSTLFLTSGYGTGGQAFTLQSDQPVALWPVSKSISACNSDPIIHDGYVYSFSGNGLPGALKCLDLKTGVEKWSTDTLGNGTAVLVDGALLCFGYNGTLSLVEAKPDAFKKIASQSIFPVQGPPAYAAPAIAGGRVYLRYRGALACFDLKRP